MKAPLGEPLILWDSIRNWAYIATPKCAMTSILEAIEAYWHLTPEPVHQREWPSCGTRNLLIRNPHIKTFAVGRDPRERLVSLWVDKIWCPGRRRKKQMQTDSPELFEMIGMKFPEFVKHVCDRVFSDTTDRHIMPQSWFLTLDGKQIFHELFKIEHLPAMWVAIRRRYGFGPLGLSNRTDHHPWTSYYDPEIEQLVLEAYSDDFDITGYPKAVLCQ